VACRQRTHKEIQSRRHASTVLSAENENIEPEVMNRKAKLNGLTRPRVTGESESFAAKFAAWPK
jgi:hypothetical protein